MSRAWSLVVAESNVELWEADDSDLYRFDFHGLRVAFDSVTQRAGETRFSHDNVVIAKIYTTQLYEDVAAVLDQIADGRYHSEESDQEGTGE